MLLLRTDQKLQLDLPGVSQTAQGIEFSDNYTEKDVRNIREKVGLDNLSITSTLVNRKEYKPSEAEMARLGGSVKNLKNIKFFEAVAIQSYIDHHKDVLTQSFQELLAEKYNQGRTFLFGHNSSFGIGRVFGAEVRAIDSDPAEWETVVKFFVSHKAILPSSMTAVAAIEQGVYERVSIGFTTDLYKYIPESESEKGTGYWLFDVPPGADTSGTEAFELSLVGFGAQPGAAIKAQNAPIEKIGKIEKTKSSMEFIKYQIQNAGTIEVSEKSQAAMDKHQAEFTSLQKAVQDQSEKLKEFEGLDIAQLKADSDNWQKFAVQAKDEQIKTLISLKKQAFGEEAVKAESETEALKAFDLAYLKDEVSRFKVLVDSKANPLPITGNGKEKVSTSGLNF